MNFAVIDFIFIGLILLFIIRGFFIGFISEFLSMAGILFGVLVSIIFHESLALFLRSQFFPEMDNIIPEIIAFAALFIAVTLIITFIKILLKGIITGANLGGADKFLGLIFGFAEGVAVAGLILFLLGIIQPVVNTGVLLENSFFAKLLLPVITGIKLPPINFPLIESLPYV